MFITLALASIATGKAAPSPPSIRPHLAVHLRPEARVHPGFDAGQDDAQVAVQQGLRLGASAAAGPIRARMDVQEVRAWGVRASSASVEPALGAYQGYVEFDAGQGYVRVGRQELHWLNGYFLSRAPFNPAGRSFDAVRWHGERDGLDMDLFLSQLRSSQGFIDGEAPIDVGDWFGGAQTSGSASGTFRPSLFLLGKAGGPTEAEPDRSDWWVGPGARATLSIDETRLEVDLLTQFGDASGTPRRAYNAIARVEQGFGGAARPGVALRIDQSSGHACTEAPGAPTCTSEVLREMDLQFGRALYLRGMANQVAGTNSRQLALEAFVRPEDTLRVEIIGSWFRLTDPAGPWVRNGGQFQGSGWSPGNTEPGLGWELDARVAWRATPECHIDGGLAWFQPVGVGAALTGSAPQAYAFTRTRLTF